MAVRFILGRAGSGKTHYCVGRVVQMCRADPLGSPVFYIVPKQATFQVQRKLVAELGGFSRIRVASFDQVGQLILDACGGVGVPDVTAVGRLLLIGHVLRKMRRDLRFYQRSAAMPGLAAELDDTFGEFDRAGVDGQKLDELLAGLSPETDPALVDKLTDVRAIFMAYQAYVGQERLDPGRRMAMVLKKVSDCDLFAGAVVFVDDFYDFTGHERELLVAIAGRAADTNVSLQLDEASAGVTDEAATFHRTHRTFGTLRRAFERASIPIVPAVSLDQPRRYTGPALAAVESSFAGRAVVERAGSAVAFVEAADRRAEADAVARKIRDAVSRGRRYRDVCVLVRDLSTYQEVLRTTFGEYGIPFFADVRRSATHHPVVRLIRAAMSIVGRHWPTDAVLTFAKSGLAGLSDDEADELENAAFDLNADHSDWTRQSPWRSQDNASAVDDQDRPTSEIDVDKLRQKLVDALSPLVKGGGTRTVSAWVKGLSDVLEGLQVRAELFRWMATAAQDGDLEQRAEHEQVWTNTVELMDQLGQLLGDEPYSSGDFVAVLDSALARFELAISPPTLDQVLVGQVDRTRTPEVKLAFVLGLNEGEFPKTRDEPAVLSDADRRVLRNRNFELDQDTERLLLDERFLGYLAFTRASDQLVLCRPRSGEDGRSRTPSRFWTTAARVVAGTPVELVERQGRAGAGSVGTAAQAVAGTMQSIRRGPMTDGWDAIYDRLAARDPSFAKSVSAGWAAMTYSNTPTLSNQSARAMFPGPLSTTADELETFAQCPFRHFVRYGLALADRRDPEVTGRDQRAIISSVLREAVAPGSMFDAASGNADRLDEAMDQIGELVETARRRLNGPLNGDAERVIHLVDGITRRVRQVVMSAVLVNRLGNMRWIKAGVRFGTGKELPALELQTPGRSGVVLHGRIERLDIGPGDRVIVTDYRQKASKLSLDKVTAGLTLRLLTQLLVVGKNGGQLLGRPLIPVGALTVPLGRPIEAIKDLTKAVDPAEEAFHLRHKVVGLFAESAIELLHREVFTGPSSAFNVFRKVDGTLGNVERSDALSTEQFEAVLRLTQLKLGELADEIMSGDISVSPTEIGSYRACQFCDYRSVCRFDPVLDKYRTVPTRGRADVLVELSVRGRTAEG